MNLRYTIYDTVRQRYLTAFHKPIDEVDAAVTNWSRHSDRAMKFPGTKSARKVSQWLNANDYGGCIVLNARGNIV